MTIAKVSVLANKFQRRNRREGAVGGGGVRRNAPALLFFSTCCQKETKYKKKFVSIASTRLQILNPPLNFTTERKQLR